MATTMVRNNNNHHIPGSSPMSGTCPAAVKQTICKQISPAQASQISWACHMQGRHRKRKETKTISRRSQRRRRKRRRTR
jgi:hypothetical protein